MSKIQSLLDSYARYLNLPWQSRLSSQERVWFCLYNPANERRLRARLDSFRLATQEANHGWLPLDITCSFETWLSQHEYRDQFFANPQGAAPAYDLFQEDLAQKLVQDLEASDSSTVAALVGVGALFGLIRVSNLIEAIAPSIKGRLLVFFPGTYHNFVYRLLDARDGWNYLAIPIEAKGGLEWS
jgi:hypothetical protein